MLKRAVRLASIAVVGITLLIGGGAIYARSQMRASLPQIDGTAAVSGLTANVRVDRDALGVPTITGATREDVARALGFLHAQDRFFQMDLQRRQPAGELSGLVGPRAMQVDEDMRAHRFRNVAHRALELAEPSYRKILEAYAAGVNAGLNALGAAPFEYLVLRATPQPWLPEDSILTVLAMFNTLQGRQAAFEQSHGALRDTLPEPMFRFLSTAGSDWETPVVGNAIVRPPIPESNVFDLRDGHHTSVTGASGFSRIVPDSRIVPEDEASIIGSNNWAVDGAHSASGAAILANDMHLSIGVPIIWYRASMVFPTNQRLTGVTLPGIPSMVVGSNGHVAWGFTNTGGDWSDLIRIEPDARDPQKYLTPEGPKAFDVFEETIAAKGAPSKTVLMRWTMWGPVVWKDARGREYAQRWVAHDATALASDITRPERARSVDELWQAVAGLGIPNQNVTMADTMGRIAWTIGGAIPKRIGHDGMTPESWADGTHRWDGYLTTSEFPRIVDPKDGRIWTANSPVVDGTMLAAIGEGGYADGIRARLIRDRLMKIDKATPVDMLSIQLEDRALFLERWRKLLLDTIEAPGSPIPDPGAGRREEFRRLIDSKWTGRASPESVGYRLVKEFRLLFVRRVMTSLTEPAKSVDPEFDYTRLLRGEGPVWQIVSERPMHLLDPKYKTWDDAILDTVDAVIAQLTDGGRSLADRTWGEANSAEIRHPLAGAIPFVGRYLNMPGDPLPGDVYTPRASTPRTGPSERMAVSPGRENEGILHIPTGQSGHPLSPHYGDQYRAWLNGEPTPFLPGTTVTTLTLTPRP
ncbi:MAG: penicillin acylase family protein [Cyanobacteria bacterium]|nr:penicillin acylase family protein [Cyanobacteriota bacterium]